MLRLLIVLAVACGIFWYFSNNSIDFTKSADYAKSKIQTEKTIQAVTKGRQQNAQDVQNALDY